MKSEPDKEKVQEENAETVVKKVLEKLVAEDYILGFFRAARNREMDERGIDFLLILHGGLALPLQVKRRNKENKSAGFIVGHHYQKHPLILFVLFVNTRRKRCEFLTEIKIRRAIRRAVAKTQSFYPPKSPI